MSQQSSVQIPISSLAFGQSVAIYVRYRVLEDSTKAAVNTDIIYAGNAVSLTSAGLVTRTLTNVAVYGLAKNNMNSYRNEVNDASFGIYGSGLMTVVVKGIVDLMPSYFPNTDGSYTTVQTWDTAPTYYAGDPIYVMVAGATPGILTKTLDSTVDSTRNDNTLVGTVLMPPSSTTPMQILLK
jgi:hypothetical protein